MPEEHRREAATGTCRGKRLQSNCRGVELRRRSCRGEFAAFRLRRIFSLRIAENLPEDPSGGELKLAPHLRRPRVPVSGIQRLRICSMTGFCVKTIASQPLPNCFPRLVFSRTSPRSLVMPEEHRREVRQEHVAGSGCEAIVGAVKR